MRQAGAVRVSDFARLRGAATWSTFPVWDGAGVRVACCLRGVPEATTLVVEPNSIRLPGVVRPRRGVPGAFSAVWDWRLGAALLLASGYFPKWTSSVVCHSQSDMA